MTVTSNIPSGRGRGPRRPPPRQVEVVSTSRLTPNLLAITFGGDSLATFAQPAPTAHIKLFLPEPDGTMRVGVAGPDGGVEWPEGRPTMRTYTPRRFDAEARELEVWFVLHGEGPAAVWAGSAKPGDRAAIGGPGGRFSVDPDVNEWWIGGDESALPAVATLIEALPATARAAVHLEVGGAVDEIAMPAHPGMTITWHHRASSTLEDALPAADLTADTHVWVACEAQAVRRLRSHLLEDRGHSPARVTTRGYWRVGEANHPDHDFGED